MIKGASLLTVLPRLSEPPLCNTSGGSAKSSSAPQVGRSEVKGMAREEAEVAAVTRGGGTQAAVQTLTLTTTTTTDIATMAVLAATTAAAATGQKAGRTPGHCPMEELSHLPQPMCLL